MVNKQKTAFLCFHFLCLILHAALNVVYILRAVLVFIQWEHLSIILCIARRVTKKHVHTCISICAFHIYCCCHIMFINIRFVWLLLWWSFCLCFELEFLALVYYYHFRFYSARRVLETVCVFICKARLILI